MYANILQLTMFEIFWPEMTHLKFYPVKNMYIGIFHRIKFQVCQNISNIDSGNILREPGCKKHPFGQSQSELFITTKSPTKKTENGQLI